MKHFIILTVILYFGQGTGAVSSCQSAPLLGCGFETVPCNHGHGTCKDCCDNEIGDVEMGDSAECTGQCKCCGVCPSPRCVCRSGQHLELFANANTGCKDCKCVGILAICPSPSCVCHSGQVPEYFTNPNTGCWDCYCVPGTTPHCPAPHCVCPSGQRPELFTNQNTGCDTCTCVPVSCSAIPLCGCPPSTVTEVYQNPRTGCLNCQCVRKDCPEVFCRCQRGTRKVTTTRNGCPTCACESCPRVACPLCLSNKKQVYSYDNEGCTTCTCVAETQSCDGQGKTCGEQCTRRALCEEGEFADGLYCQEGQHADGRCITNVQHVVQCTKCKKCLADPVCIFGCKGDRVLETVRGKNGCLECQCVCHPLGECRPFCRIVDTTTGCFKCSC